MDSLIQVLDGLNGEDPKSFDQERALIGTSFQANPGVGSKLDPWGVRAMQQFLGVTADGVIGPITRGAIKNWQVKNGLTGTGIWDQASANKYMGGTAVQVPPPTTSNDPTSCKKGYVYDPYTKGCVPLVMTPPVWPEANPNWPGSVPPPPSTPPSIVPTNTKTFVDKLKSAVPEIALIGGGLALAGIAFWLVKRQADKV